MQVIRNIELEKALLKTELALHQKEESVGEMEERNARHAMREDCHVTNHAAVREEANK